MSKLTAALNIFFILAWGISSLARGFNLATDKPIWASAADQVRSAGDYFGYSLAVDADTSSLFVGAPGFRESGAVFRCDFDGKLPTSHSAGCSVIAGQG